MKTQNIISVAFLVSLMLSACVPSMPTITTATVAPSVVIVETATHIPPPTLTPEPAYLTLQEENNSPKTKLATKTPQELADNHIGGDIGNWDWIREGDNSDVYRDLLQSIDDLGIKWARTNFWSPNPLNWQEVLREPGIYYIPQDVDDFITDLSDHGVNIILTLSAGAGLDSQQYGWWGGPGWEVLGNREPDWWFKTQGDRDRFTDYARFMAQHFQGRVTYYEI